MKDNFTNGNENRPTEVGNTVPAKAGDTDRLKVGDTLIRQKFK